MFKKINYYFLIVLVAFIPFGRFFQDLIESHFAFSPALNFWLAHWYEPVVVVLFVVTLTSYLAKHKFKFSLLQICVGSLLLFGLISIGFIASDISRGIEGFRFELFAILIFALTLLSNFEQEQFRKIKSAYIYMAFFVAAWAIFERFLPADYWQVFHILRSNSPYWYGSHSTGNILQSVSLIGGPNQLASFLLPAFFLLYIDFKKKDFTIYIQLLIVLLAILLTFSRSAWLGLVAGFLLYEFFIQTDRVRRKKVAIASFLLLLVGIFGFFFGGTGIHSLYTHGASQQGHVSSINQSIDLIKNSNFSQIVFGRGLGMIGPASFKYLNSVSIENWYLEILLSLGLIGIGLFLFILFHTLKKLNRDKKYGLVVGLASVLVCALFLPTLSDNPAVTYIIFILIGMQFQIPKEKDKIALE